jgi:hypothetical protein
MAKRNQHYVPRVYTKAWETQVSSLKEPQKVFNGVYYYEKTNLVTGDGRNKGSILTTDHTYTIDFNYTFILPQCPEIRKEFADGIKLLLQERQIIARYKGKSITSRNSISTNLPFLDEWDFIDYQGRVASKKSAVNAIKEIRSYCLEDKFSAYMESRWEDTLKAFLSPFPSSVGKGQIDFTFSTQKPIKDMLDMTALMMCRNPSFDLFGLYSFVGNKLLNPVFSQWGNADEAQKATEQMIRGLWLTEIYRGLFNHKNGFTSEFLSQGLTNLGIIIFRIATETDGSFITSDNPVVFQKMCVTTNRCPNGIYFPLTPQFLLFLGKRTEGTINDVIFRTVGNNDVREINRVILNGAQKAIVSTNKHLGYIL